MRSLGEQRRKPGDGEARVAREGRGNFFRAPPLARDFRFALASLTPQFAQHTQKITPLLRAIHDVKLADTCICLQERAVRVQMVCSSSRVTVSSHRDLRRFVFNLFLSIIGENVIP